MTATPSPSSTRCRVPLPINFVSDAFPSGVVYAVRIVTPGFGGGGVSFAGAGFAASGLAAGFFCVAGGAFGFCVDGAAGFGFCAVCAEIDGVITTTAHSAASRDAPVSRNACMVPPGKG